MSNGPFADDLRLLKPAQQLMVLASYGYTHALQKPLVMAAPATTTASRAAAARTGASAPVRAAATRASTSTSTAAVGTDA